MGYECIGAGRLNPMKIIVAYCLPKVKEKQ